MPSNDAALIDQWIRSRDARAFSELVSRHASMVFGTSRRILRDSSEAEDVAQECFITLSQAERPMERSVGGWLHRVATNRSLSRLRSDSRRESREQSYAENASTTEEIQWDDLREHVDEAIATIPEDLRCPIVLYFFEGQTHKQIAQSLGITRSGATRRISRGIDAVREELTKRGVTVGGAVLSALLLTNGVDAAPKQLVDALNRYAVAAPDPPLARAAGRAVTLTAAALVAVLLMGAAAIYVTLRNQTAAKAERHSVAPQGTEAPTLQLAAQSAQDEAEADAHSEPPSVDVEPVADDTQGFRARCVDESGAPVVGAEVYWVRSERRWAQSSHRREDTRRETGGPEISDDAGYVTIPLDLADIASDRVAIYGYGRVPGQLVAGWFPKIDWTKPDAKREIPFVESATIRGTVVVPDGYPISKVTVQMQNYFVASLSGPGAIRFFAAKPGLETPWPGFFEALPAEDGTFELHDLPIDGAVTLGAHGEGLGFAQAVANPRAKATENTIELEAAAIIEGSVRYHPGGAPAADVLVYARPEGGPRNPKVLNTHGYPAVTDSSGHYRVDGLPEAEYAVKVETLGSPPEWVAAVQTKIIAEAGATTAGVDLLLERGAIVEGRVLTLEDKTPVPGAMLGALNPSDSGDITIGWSETGPDGRFILRLPLGDSQVYFSKIGPGYKYPKDQGIKIIDVASSQTSIRDVDFYLKVDKTIQAPLVESTATGCVVDSNGNPLSGVSIIHSWEYMQGDAERRTQSEVGRSGDHGGFNVKFYSRGKHAISVGGNGFSFEKGELFTVEDGEHYDAGEVIVTEYTMTMSLRVLDPLGSPIQSATIRVNADAYRHQTLFGRKTDGDGYVLLEKLPDYEVSVNVLKQEYADVWEQLRPGFDYEIRMKPGESSIP